MKFFKYLFLFTLFLSVLMGCKESIESDSIEDVKLSPYKTVKADEICEISVPKYFYEINDINPRALIQQGYVEEVDSSKKASKYIGDEIYTIVFVDYKFEMEQIYGDTIEVGIEMFNQMCQENLEMILDDFSAEFENPKVQVENGVKSIHNEFLGRIDEYLVYYQIGVFETETGFYQVLTWTMQEYMNKHKEEMLVITTSFQEL